MFRSEIETLADILDEHIEKGLAKESQSKIERIEKALSHDPFNPIEMNYDSPYYNPYKMAPEGGFLPYTSQHWADQGKDQSNYLTTDQFYDRYGEVKQAVTRFRGFARSLENDLKKAGAVPIGTVHKYKDGVNYKKTGEGQWIPVSADGKQATPKDIEGHASTVSKISSHMKERGKHEETKKQAVSEALKTVKQAVAALFDGPMPDSVNKVFDSYEPKKKKEGSKP